MILLECRKANTPKDVFNVLKRYKATAIFNVFAPHAGSLLSNCSSLPFNFSDIDIVKSIRGSGLKIFGDIGSKPWPRTIDNCQKIVGGFIKRGQGVNGYKKDDLILACAILYLFDPQLSLAA